MFESLFIFSAGIRCGDILGLLHDLAQIPLVNFPHHPPFSQHKSFLLSFLFVFLFVLFSNFDITLLARSCSGSVQIMGLKLGFPHAKPVFQSFEQSS